MAPTEILARQHLEALRPLAEEANVVLEILTGRDKGAERRAKLRALSKGDIQILVGTHAVFQTDVTFSDLRLAIVDEQQPVWGATKVGVGAQRAGHGRTGYDRNTHSQIAGAGAIWRYGCQRPRRKTTRSQAR